ncbi:MAG: hypothetical protein IPJ84_18960 [Bdellovibrionales bacterium]|nr:hypothetical protein [Bdellovibrionales bacterium]
MNNDEPKLWTAGEIASMCCKLGGFVAGAEFIQAPKHDSIVAKLRAEVEELKRILRDVDNQCLQDEQTIAKQAKVIEKLTEQRNRAADRHHGQSLAKYKEKIKKFEAEIAEIERGEA